MCKGPEARQTCLVQRLNGVNGGSVAKQREAAETRYVGRAAGEGSWSLPFRVRGNQRHFKQRTIGRSQTPSCVQCLACKAARKQT